MARTFDRGSRGFSSHWDILSWLLYRRHYHWLKSWNPRSRSRLPQTAVHQWTCSSSYRSWTQESLGSWRIGTRTEVSCRIQCHLTLTEPTHQGRWARFSCCLRPWRWAGGSWLSSCCSDWLRRRGSSLPWWIHRQRQLAPGQRDSCGRKCRRRATCRPSCGWCRSVCRAGCPPSCCPLLRRSTGKSFRRDGLSGACWLPRSACGRCCTS